MKSKRIVIFLILIAVLVITAVSCTDDGGIGVYRITFIMNGGTTADGVSASFSTNIRAGHAIVFPPDPKHPSGLVFSGWFFDFAWTDRLEEDTFTKTPLKSNQTVYARWVEGKEPEIPGNGGTEEPKIVPVHFVFGYDFTKVVINLQGALTQEFIYGFFNGEFNGTLPYPAFQGHDFEEWYTDSRLESRLTLPFALEEETFLYAKWQPKSFNLLLTTEEVFVIEDARTEGLPSLIHSGGFLHGQPPSAETKVFFGGQFTIPQNEMQFNDSEGILYTFLGWVDIADGNKEYLAGQTYPVSREADMDLRMKWLRAYPVVLYHAGYPSQAETAIMFAGNELILPVSGAVSADERFLGWIEIDLDGSAVSGNLLTAGTKIEVLADAMYFSAVWARLYAVTLFAGEELSHSIQPVILGEFIEGEEFIMPDWTGRGGDSFVFKGWNYELTSGQTLFIEKGESFKMSGRDLGFTAVWEPAQSFTVSYNSGGGELNPQFPIPDSFTQGRHAEDDVLLLPMTPVSYFRRLNYLFAGWDINGTFQASGTFKMPHENVVITALWEVQNYQIVYSVAQSGADLSLLTTEYSLNKTTVYVPQLSLRGYEFGGWFTDSNHQNSVASGSLFTVENDASGFGFTMVFNAGVQFARVNLFAKFTALSFTITLKCAVLDREESLVVSYDEDYQRRFADEASKFVRSGEYERAYWNLNGEVFPETGAWNRLENIVLILVWTIKPTHGLVFSPNGNGALMVSGISGNERRVAVPEYYNRLPVTAVASNAFQNSLIEAITLPEGIVSIGANAFAGSRLEYIVLPNSVTAIGAGAFQGALSLEYVTASENSRLVSVGANAFAGCIALESVILPYAVRSIGAGAFGGSPNLVIFAMAHAVQPNWHANWNLGNNPVFFGTVASDSEPPHMFPVFSDIDGNTLYAVNNPNGGVTAVRLSIVTPLSELRLPKQVTAIASNVFSNLSLTSLVLYIGAECLSIANDAFPVRLSAIYLLRGIMPNETWQNNQTVHINSHSSGLFDYRLESVGGETNAHIYAYRGAGGAVVIPNEIDGYLVASIGQTFRGNISITSITLPATVTVIAYEAFLNCVNLREINLAERNALGGIASAVQHIGRDAFKGCYSLRLVDLGGLESVPNGAFENCVSLRSVRLSSTIAFIGEGAFKGAVSLSEIIMPSGLSLKEIGDSAFEGCTSLTLNGALLASLERLGARAFFGVKHMNDMHIGRALSYIGAEAFAYAGIDRFIADSQNEYYSTHENVLFTADGSVLIAYPRLARVSHFIVSSAVKSIAPYAYAGTVYLNAVSLGLGVIYIGENAFGYSVATVHSPLANMPNTWGSDSFAVNVKVSFTGGETYEISAGIIYKTENNTAVITGFTGELANDSVIEIPSQIGGVSVSEIVAGAFDGAKFLVMLIPNSVSVHEDAFVNSTSATLSLERDLLTSLCGEFLYFINGNGGAEIVKYIGNSRFVEIPNALDGKPVTAVRDYAFSYTSVRSAYVFASVASIASYAFESENYIVVYTNGNSLMGINAVKVYYQIEVSALGLNENGFQTINNGRTLTRYLGDGGSVTTPTLTGSQVVPSFTVGSFAFAGISDIRKIEFTPSVYILLEERAVAYCYGLTAVEFSIATIRTRAFEDCTNLSEVILHGTAGLSRFEFQAFKGCVSLINIASSFASRPSGNAGWDIIGYAVSDIEIRVDMVAL
ncbi:MAG: leucine-rich repeat protein [Firmicutes bacterium]|nr:leucine-rich repeat protein [Bacillota bacterium]